MTDEELVKAMAEIKGWHIETLGDQEWICCDVGKLIKLSDWNPLTNANHWMMMVERMRNVGESLRLNFNCKIVFYRNLIEVEFWQPAGISAVESHDNNIGHAVCLAALQAWEAYKREIK